MAKKKKRPTRVPRTEVSQPKRRAVDVPRRWLLYGAAAAGVAAVAIVLAVVVLTRGGGSEKAAAGLPATPDYHSLLVADGRLLLGTHNGVYVSTDGGRQWRFDSLARQDAMNLARRGGGTVWLAGHNVFKKSTDGGSSWTDVGASGLPSLDIHGFAADPRDPDDLYAAVAGNGLYRSRDAGRTFSRVSDEVGASVFALAVLPGSRLLAGDAQQGLLQSDDGGKNWTPRLEAQVLGLAANPRDPARVLAGGSGGIALSTDGGRSWRAVLELADGAGPVTWSRADPNMAYAVGFDRVLYRSDDAGESWQAVE